MATPSHPSFFGGGGGAVPRRRTPGKDWIFALQQPWFVVS
ncbi:hypothetical protein HMPREF0262_02546 [Clostridium sp. ATCC 29733]|nr:hypothetical protein HMPREF0262_02546 [Clostridium sp. ATCC 29733]